MPVHFPAGYALPGGDLPLSHSRIAHAGNWITGAITASSTAAVAIYAADAPANLAFYERWKPATVPATWEITSAASVVVDYCVIAAHDLNKTGGAVAIEYHNGVSWVEVVDLSAVTSGAALFFIFAPVTATRFRVANSGAASSFGFIRFGRALQMEERTAYPGRTPFDLARRVVATGDQSVRGEFLARTKIRQGQSLGFSWSHLSEGFVNGELKGFLDATEDAPFVIAERPGTHPNDVALGWLSGGRPLPRATGQMDLHALDIQVEGYVEND